MTQNGTHRNLDDPERIVSIFTGEPYVGMTFQTYDGTFEIMGRLASDTVNGHRWICRLNGNDTFCIEWSSACIKEALKHPTKPWSMINRVSLDDYRQCFI